MLIDIIFEKKLFCVPLFNLNFYSCFSHIITLQKNNVKKKCDSYSILSLKTRCEKYKYIFINEQCFFQKKEPKSFLIITIMSIYLFTFNESPALMSLCFVWLLQVTFQSKQGNPVLSSVAFGNFLSQQLVVTILPKNIIKFWRRYFFNLFFHLLFIHFEIFFMTVVLLYFCFRLIGQQACLP